MKTLEDYIAFDLEFNQYEGAYQIIQVLSLIHIYPIPRFSGTID